MFCLLPTRTAESPPSPCPETVASGPPNIFILTTTSTSSTVHRSSCGTNYHTMRPPHRHKSYPCGKNYRECSCVQAVERRIPHDLPSRIDRSLNKCLSCIGRYDRVYATNMTRQESPAFVNSGQVHEPIRWLLPRLIPPAVQQYHTWMIAIRVMRDHGSSIVAVLAVALGTNAKAMVISCHPRLPACRAPPAPSPAQTRGTCPIHPSHQNPRVGGMRSCP